jgi:uncharacterized membrane protein
MRTLAAYGTTLIVLVALDLVWLRYASNAFFRPLVGEILTDKPNFVAAALFYLIFAAGLTYFAVSPALHCGRITIALLNGALLGFLAYMCFDLTNMAILRLWPLKVALIDMSWGTLVSGVSAALGFIIASRWVVK